ncbi:hypothetical protein OG455_17720 [Kitasatospora sp. NBC_01287]|uniref:hypothetical protein n=1 Tax=Kitasatospora sp. NBC_01287 TaxID=2903573 RepID=UPI00225AA88E|nr:hypothetical protein [Kitasatospora sp. NBC_01287]MCX4747337.1 hypothetical protein [Kitasatospora sp. NBC_01287]
MAGGQADERPGEALTGGLSGGEWWRVDGPWRVLGTAPESAGVAEDGVYVTPPPAGPTAVPAPPTEPPVVRRPAQGGATPAGPEVPVPPARRPVFRKGAPSAQAGPGEPPGAAVEDGGTPAAWLIAPAAPGPLRAPTAADFPGWDSVVIEFPPDDTAAAEPPAEERVIPGQRGRAEPQPADGEADPAAGQRAGQGAGRAAGQAGAKGSFLAGRRPSPLLLLAAGVLVGGAVSGVILVLLAGWGLAYLSARLGALAKKFVVFGIPLITMSASTLWFWGRAQGRWGDPLSKGAPMTHAAYAAAPGVLRLAAVLSALFLLAVALKRRGPKTD